MKLRHIQNNFKCSLTDIMSCYTLMFIDKKITHNELRKLFVNTKFSFINTDYLKMIRNNYEY